MEINEFYESTTKLNILEGDHLLALSKQTSSATKVRTAKQKCSKPEMKLLERWKQYYYKHLNSVWNA